MPHEITFWDISKRLDRFRARALTRKVFERPEILGEMRQCVEKTWDRDTCNRRSLSLWRNQVATSPKEFADFVLADSLRAIDARESYLPFFIVDPIFSSSNCLPR